MDHWLPAPGVLALAWQLLAAKVSWLREMTGLVMGVLGRVQHQVLQLKELPSFYKEEQSPAPPYSCWQLSTNECSLVFEGYYQPWLYIPRTVCLPRSHCWKQAASLRPNLFHPSRHLVFSAAKSKQRWEEVVLLQPQRTGLPPTLLQRHRMWAMQPAAKADDLTVGLWTAISQCTACAPSPRGKQFRR